MTDTEYNLLAELKPNYIDYQTERYVIYLPQGTDRDEIAEAATWLNEQLEGEQNFGVAEPIKFGGSDDYHLAVNLGTRRVSHPLAELVTELARPSCLRKCTVNIVIRRDSSNGVHLGTLVCFKLPRAYSFSPPSVSAGFGNSDVKLLTDMSGIAGAMLTKNTELVFSLERPEDTPFGEGHEPIEAALAALKLWPEDITTTDTDFHGPETRLLPACAYSLDWSG